MKSRTKRGALSWRSSSVFASFLLPIVLYFISAVPIQVLFVNGYFLNKPRTFRFLEVAYTPAAWVFKRSATLNMGFESTVQFVLLHQKLAHAEHADEPVGVR